MIPSVPPVSGGLFDLLPPLLGEDQFASGDAVFAYISNSTANPADKIALLRRHFRHRMFAAGARDIAELRPIYSSFAETTSAAEAAISAVHAAAPSGAATDWAEIVGLYDALARADPSPVIELNRAVAVAMRDGPAAGLTLIDAILAQGDLVDYRLAHAARADLCRRLGRTADARRSYERALALTRQEPERRFLERRLAELPN